MFSGVFALRANYLLEILTHDLHVFVLSCFCLAVGDFRPQYRPTASDFRPKGLSEGSFSPNV